MDNDNKQNTTQVLSDFAVEYIKKYIMPAMDIKTAIDVSLFNKIEDQLYLYEDDNYNDDGTEKSSDAPNFERNKHASKVLGELLHIWSCGDIDYNDLNDRLKLLPQ